MLQTVSQTPIPGRRLGTLFGVSVVAIVVVLGWAVQHRDGDGAINLARDQQRLPLNFLVDVNTGRWVELANLPGIGPKTAKAIVAYRISAGGFKSVDQILDVKGVGPKTLQRVRRFLVLAEQGARQTGLAQHGLDQNDSALTLDSKGHPETVVP